ncbi:MAG TPA: C45 family autoproteolytic acyltransferase/hydrolase [Planctomycetaceae bacterium]|nr:C45 family autoproteolytic acyltransferase/hydrolase [Planctomycetaceae bacterium]HQZ63670.1 C45 family autoproteolytic acyltransferase/hydrolase [Planctomycetaceae bacterium]HRA90175.1 C45 family autoproteolytic acyltransferase/hydrolase [Planctomycetaceae bacterium]
MNKPARYREIKVSGPPRELGRQLGEQARDEIRGFCAVALERVNKTVTISRERAYDIARRSGEFANEFRPDLIQELQGTAEAAGVTLDDLLMLQVRNQYQPEKAEACTSISFSPSAGIRSGPIVAQTWDSDPALDEFTIVLTRQPEGKPAFISCTQAGLISYMGMSEAGIATCINTLPAPSRGVGVPHYFILREMYEATSLDAAVASLERAHRAIPVNIMMSTPQGPADLEATVDTVHVLRPNESASCVTHTNHCVHSDLLPINDDFPELAQSYGRKRRIDELLSSGDRDIDLDRIKTLLSDHENYPRSICRHVSNDPDCGFWETVFAIIIEPDQRRMHITRGTPCDHPFEVYEMR